MRHGSTGKRSRNRSSGGRRGGNQGRTHVYDSNGPDVRIRGTAHQVFEKYVALAKDASGSGDYILAESYMQHAEHYQRIISGWHHTVEGETSYLNQDDQDHMSPRGRRQTHKDKQSDLDLPESITGRKAIAGASADEKTGALEDA